MTDRVEPYSSGGSGRKKRKLTNPLGLASTPSIINPWVDFICVGGLSIAVMAGLLMYILLGKPEGQAEVHFGSFIILHALINWPHFMASYRLLYKPAANIRKHPFAAVYVPLVLVLVVIAGFVLGRDSAQAPSAISVQQDIAYYVWLVAAFYLAWHYTGQAWGMMASFSHLAGIKMTGEERLTLRSGLRVLLVWHVVWGAQDLPQHWLGPVYPYLPSLLNLVSACAIAAFIIGAVTIVGIKRRTGKTPTPQMLAPWLAVYLWYLVLNFEPNAYVFVQLSHALQYLIFPLRVELNRSQPDVTRDVPIKQFLWSSRYYVLLVAAGLIVYYFPNLLFKGEGLVYGPALLISAAVSIHHYFVDGCIWKLSNKEVRGSLFSHIKA